MNEQTFVIIKPDAIAQNLVGRIISRFDDIDLHIECIEKRRKDDNWCRQHYAHILEYTRIGTVEVSVYEYLRDFMINQFTIGIILRGPDAIKRVRRMIGATNALEAEPGTIRGDWGKSFGPYNLIHASDSVETVGREIELYFNPETDW